MGTLGTTFGRSSSSSFLPSLPFFLGPLRSLFGSVAGFFLPSFLSAAASSTTTLGAFSSRPVDAQITLVHLDLEREAREDPLAFQLDVFGAFDPRELVDELSALLEAVFLLVDDLRHGAFVVSDRELFSQSRHCVFLHLLSDRLHELGLFFFVLELLFGEPLSLQILFKVLRYPRCERLCQFSELVEGGRSGDGRSSRDVEDLVESRLEEVSVCSFGDSADAGLNVRYSEVPPARARIEAQPAEYVFAQLEEHLVAGLVVVDAHELVLHFEPRHCRLLFLAVGLHGVVRQRRRGRLHAVEDVFDDFFAEPVDV